MANIVKDAEGRKRIQFMSLNGTRRTIRLGKVTMEIAQDWKSNVEIILADLRMHRSHDPRIATWLGEMDEKFLKKLRAVGLAEGVGQRDVSLKDLLENFSATLTVKPSTKVFYSHTQRNLMDFLGAPRIVRTISTADADAWRAWLAKQKVADRIMSPATVARRVIAARTIFNAAIRWKMMNENPFKGVRAGKQSNDQRKHFVKQEVIDHVIAHINDPEWKVILSLSRYGGLRCPSEHLALRWDDVDFDRGSMRVRSSKTEHHEGGSSRIAPIRKKLREHLQKLRETTPTTSEFVITRYRQPSCNLRTQLKRYLKAAGIVPWPRLFHNLRASCETEWLERYGIDTACRWIGNSPEVAARHYAVSADRDANLRDAAGLGRVEEQPKDGAKSGAADAGNASQG